MIVYPNAKINLGLSVVARRADGYHELETVFCPIALSDVMELVVAQQQSTPITMRVEGLPLDVKPEDNICVRALCLLSQRVKLPPISVLLRKVVPSGAGLGGGSADAAFVLTGVNNMLRLGLSSDELKQMAAKLGADCAFFVDNKAAYATGIGDKLQPIELKLAGKHIIIVKPDVFVSTKEAYAGITPKRPEVAVKDVIQMPIERWKELLINDFEESIFRRHPLIAQIKAELYARGALYASMSGSGSAVYGIFNDYVDVDFGPHFTWKGVMS